MNLLLPSLCYFQSKVLFVFAAENSYSLKKRCLNQKDLIFKNRKQATVKKLRMQNLLVWSIL